MVQESMRTAPGHQVKELVLKINLSLLNLTGKTCNRGSEDTFLWWAPGCVWCRRSPADRPPWGEPNGTTSPSPGKPWSACCSAEAGTWLQKLPLSVCGPHALLPQRFLWKRRKRRCWCVNYWRGSGAGWTAGSPSDLLMDIVDCEEFPSLPKLHFSLLTLKWTCISKTRAETSSSLMQT